MSTDTDDEAIVDLDARVADELLVDADGEQLVAGVREGRVRVVVAAPVATTEHDLAAALAAAKKECEHAFALASPAWGERMGPEGSR